ncbi:MAG: EAL domain-containing protein [Beijerinckiaceae bacterium]|nr:EAL domain-containing protein [Beijerinckiaceae bacterium]
MQQTSGVGDGAEGCAPQAKPRLPDATFDPGLQCLCRLLHTPVAAILSDDFDDAWFGAPDATGLLSTSARAQALSGRLPTSAHPGRTAGLQPVLVRRLAMTSREPGAVLCLFDTKPRSFSADDEATAAGFVEIFTALLRQQRKLRAQSARLSAQAQSLAHSRKIFKRASEVAKIGVWECDLNDEGLVWTDAVYDMFELPRGSKVSRQQTLELYTPESAAELKARRAEAIRDRTGFRMEARIVTARGNPRWMRLTATVECEGDQAVRIFGMKQDISEEKALAERTRYLAEYDALTGLANRSRFQAELSGLETDPTPSCGSTALLLIDLDGFKQINDTFGHALGDECLKEIARRLQNICGAADLVARVGGDEFAVLLKACADRRSLNLMANAIVEGLRRPIERSGQSFQLGASVGVALCDVHLKAELAEFFTKADTALYAAKAAGKNTFRFFEPVMKQASELRLATIQSVGLALAQDQLDLHYQPKFQLSDGALAGFEALLRWRMPEGRTVSAGAFLAAFDDPELSDRIGRFVISRALAQAAEWKSDGLAFGHVSLNASPRQLQAPRFVDALIVQVEEAGLSPEMFEIEMTESLILTEKNGPVYRQARRLRDAGFRIAIDEFGTGYASVVRMRDFPADTIKIDRSFMRRLLSSKGDAAIVEAVLSLGGKLGKTVIAVGVETEEQAGRLAELGCTGAQGFYFSRAVAASEAQRFMFDAKRVIGQVA